jgi:hypothetical protein
MRIDGGKKTLKYKNLIVKKMYLFYNNDLKTSKIKTGHCSLPERDVSADFGYFFGAQAAIKRPDT